MTFLTLFVLFIINFCWFYIYLAVQFTQEQLNGWLWSFLQINFEPSDYNSLALVIALASQILLVAIVYMYSAYGRHIRGKFGKLQQANKQLQQQRKVNQKVLQEQSVNLAKATSIEEKNSILTEQVASLSAEIQSLESMLLNSQKEAANLQSIVNRQNTTESGTTYWQNVSSKIRSFFTKKS